MIYLASPYSSPNPAVAHERYEATQEVIAHFMKQGHHVYSPIVMCHPTALKYVMPTDAKWWEAYNNNTIRRCDALWVFAIDGWRESKGVTAEIAFAKLIGLPVYYVDDCWKLKDTLDG